MATNNNGSDNEEKSWAADHGPTHDEIIATEKDDYARRGELAPGQQPNANSPVDAAAHSGPYKEDPKKKKEERDRHALKRAQEFQEDMQKMHERMKNMMDRARDNARKIREGTEVLRSRDEDAARLFLLAEYGINSDGMSEEEVFKAVEDHVGQTIRDQEELIKEMTEIALECQKKIDEAPEGVAQAEQKILNEYNRQLEELKVEAERNNLDFGKAKYQAKYNVDENNRLLGKREEEYNFESREYSKRPMSTENPFTENPFAEKAKDIRPTPVFNAAANDAEPPKPKNPNPDLNFSAQVSGFKPPGLN